MKRVTDIQASVGTNSEQFCLNKVSP